MAKFDAFAGIMQATCDKNGRFSPFFGVFAPEKHLWGSFRTLFGAEKRLFGPLGGNGGRSDQAADGRGKGRFPKEECPAVRASDRSVSVGEGGARRKLFLGR